MVFLISRKTVDLTCCGVCKCASHRDIATSRQPQYRNKRKRPRKVETLWSCEERDNVMVWLESLYCFFVPLRNDFSSENWRYSQRSSYQSQLLQTRQGPMHQVEPRADLICTFTFCHNNAVRNRLMFNSLTAPPVLPKLHYETPIRHKPTYLPLTAPPSISKSLHSTCGCPMQQPCHQ